MSEFKARMADAGVALEQMGSRAKKAGGDAQSSMSKLAQSARDNGDAWRTAGSALMVFGGAITGIGAAALKTGIEYNTLQQTTRAALTTLTGSAEAANAQMDKLDEFARTSPFAKQTFIQAQQQMMAFGIETNKVIPYLDSVQNAVAAMGGSNQQISEITYIMSQISAASKITATDLMQFGQRGIDAATLIGSQMGMTGSEIREAITAGTLDAQTALDALAAGMQERFGGAADNVKDTFEGAIDRVKAAWRDFASTLATPLVNPEGGGLLVDWLNNLADAARRFQEMPKWAQTAIGGFTGLVGVVSLLAGGAMIAVPKMVELYDAVGRLGPAGVKAQGAVKKLAGTLGRLAPAATVLAVATVASGIAQWGAAASVSKVDIDDLAASLRDAADGADIAGTALADLFESRTAMSWLPWVTEVETAEDAIARFGASAREALSQSFWERVDRWTGMGADMAKFKEQVGQLDQALADLAANGSADLAAEMFERFAQAAIEQGVELETLKEFFPEYQAALDALEIDEATAEQQALTGALDGTSEAIQNQVRNLWDLTKAHQEAADALLNERDAQRRYEESLDAATAALEENGETLDITTEAGRRNQDALDEIADAGWDAINMMRENGATQGQLQAKMKTTRTDFVNMAEAMGMSTAEAEALADQLGLIPSQVKTDIWVNTADATRAVQNWLNTNTGKRITVWVDAKTGAQTAFRTQGYHLGPVGMATGGPVFGPGTETSDSIAALLSHNEHVLSAREVKGLGGHGAVERLRFAARTGQAPRFAEGGSPWSRPIVNVAAPAQGGGVNFNGPVYTADPDELMRTAERRQRDAQAVYSLAIRGA